ncbi:HEAT repeat-containing protein 5B [Trichinella nelsoni]|uniref:HEAT repeat-containing protein 5B n=1 Tax=Trichinella nelsoni TaxID=6336 RepID=A0A0V0RL92_9BILA|nr:HEAT repeat-containing protein 5B [Trichinella nelsoni]
MELSNSLLLNESALNQLSKPKRAVFIHEWLRYLDQILPVAEKSDIKDCQKNLLNQMSSLINSGLGPPSRHLMARCLATLFSVGDAFYLYEAVNVCNDILKVKDDSPNYLPSKLTAICCIGAMYKSLGRMVGRSFEETTQILIRSLKNAESQSRAEIMNTLACLVSGLESGGSSVHKEIYKVAKSMLLDRQMAVRCAASKCIQALVLEAQFVWTHELETLCSTCFKAFDGCTHAVRRSIAKLLGLVLATAHNPPSNAKRPAAGVHHGVGMQPPSVKPISIEDVWAILSSGFLRGGMGFLKTSTNFHSGVSKEVRAGTAMVSRCCLFHYLLFFISSNVTTLQAYVEFFTCLGSSWLEKSLAKCVRHFFDLVTSGCQGSAGHGEAVFIRQCAVFALSNPLLKLFSEKMQMIACKEMGQIIAEHMNSFGILEPIFSVLLHPSELCRIAAAWCLRCISITVPSLMTPLLERCLLRLEHNKNSANAISGYSCATAALTAAVCHCPLGIPNSKCKASPLMVKSQLARLLSALKSVFPRTKKEAEQELSRGDFCTWQVTLTSRAGSMVCYFTILLREVVSEFTVVEGSNVNCTSLLHDFCCNEEAILFDLSFLLCDYRQIEELNLADGKLSLEKSGNSLDTVLNLVTSLLPCPSVVLRYAAAEAFGRLAQVAPEPQFIAEMVQVSYDKLKLCRDANTRTGHSLALGCLHRYVGGLASGHQLDVSVSVLLALAQDTSSQLVQVWALYSLRLIADSGGPMYRSFVEPTLNVCLNLLLSSSSFTANDVGQCVSRLVAALITTVGPELQNNVGSVVRIRSNFLVISAIMSAHPDPFVQAQSIGCYQQLYLFAPLHVDLSLLVRRLCSLFTSCHLILRRAAFCCLRQLVQREARQVHQHVQALIPEGLNAAKVRIKSSASAADIASYLSAPSIQDSVLPETGIEGALFAALDDEDDPSAVSDLKEILLNLVQSLGSENLAHWLELCKDVVASADCNQSKEVPVAQDEQQEDDAWHVAESSREQERSSRWPSRVFAVQLVQKLITACEGERAHFDLALAKELQMNGRKSDYLVLHLSDLVRMSFMAATSNCTELRLAGLSCLKNVISKFADVPEPEFAGHFILEQFQAQVSAALRPAFSIDTPGNITALACEVCSSWISSGVAKDVNNLRRVHQLLVAPLSKLKTESISVHLYNESCTALEKLSVLKAWAEVYIVAMNQELGRTDRGASLCSTGQPDVCYSDVLLQLVEPELNMLVEYWLAVLRDYALLSLPAEFHSQLPAEGICFTLETADLVRPYYKSVWATVLLAASIWLSGNNFELSTVEPADEGTRLNVLKDYTKTEWFHILLGIVEASVLSIVKRISIEALCSPKNFDPLHIRFCLASIKVMLANEWAQLQLLAGAKLAVDLLNVMHRLVLTRENVQLQSLCADIVVLVLDAAVRSCDSMQSGAKGDFLPTESGGKLYCGMEGGDDGLFHVNNSIVYAALEVILCLLVRQVPEINPVIVRSKTFLAQRRSATVTLSNESRQLLTTAVRCLVKLSSMCSDEVSTERFVVLLSGRLTLLPIQLYLLTNTVRETSNLHNEPLVHGGGPASSTGGDFCPKQPAAAALQSIRCLLKKPVLLQDGATSEPDPRWVRIMQCALWSLLLTEKEESTENDRSTLILSVAIFMLNSPKPVLNHCQIRDRICGLFRSCLAEDCNFNVQVTCLQTLASTFACKDRSVSSEFIQALAPTVVDKVRSYLVSDNCGEAVTLPGGFQDACSSRVLVESLKALENLIHAAQETQQRLPLLALVVHFLLALTAVEDNVRGSKVRRQLYDFAMERMNSIGSLYTTEFKALLGQLPSLKARVEKALRSAYSTTAAPTAAAAAAAEQRFSLNFKNKQQQQPLDHQSASSSDLLNQQQSSTTAANKQTQADQPSITLTMDFSVSVRQDEFLPCLSSELQVAEGIHFQNSDHQVLFESVPAVVGTLAGQDPAQAGQGAVECRADEADVPADDGRQLFGQAGAEFRPSGDGLDAGEVFEKFVPRRPTARVGQKRDQLVENVILAEAVAPDRDAGPAVRLLQILAHLFQVGFVERKYRRVNVGQFQPFANFQIELFEIFVNFAFVLLGADIFRVKFQI